MTTESDPNQAIVYIGLYLLAIFFILRFLIWLWRALGA